MWHSSIPSSLRVVWSKDGPVLAVVVPFLPLCQSNWSDVWSCIQPQRSASKSQKSKTEIKSKTYFPLFFIDEELEHNLVLVLSASRGNHSNNLDHDCDDDGNDKKEDNLKCEEEEDSKWD